MPGINCPVLGIEAELDPAALGVGSGFAAMLLRRRLEGAQTADLLENALCVELAFEPLQRAIHRFTSANDHFCHRQSLLGQKIMP
jgi:hypothetical protein